MDVQGRIPFRPLPHQVAVMSSDEDGPVDPSEKQIEKGEDYACGNRGKGNFDQEAYQLPERHIEADDYDG